MRCVAPLFFVDSRKPRASHAGKSTDVEGKLTVSMCGKECVELEKYVGPFGPLPRTWECSVEGVCFLREEFDRTVVF